MKHLVLQTINDLSNTASMQLIDENLELIYVLMPYIKTNNRSVDHESVLLFRSCSQCQL